MDIISLLSNGLAVALIIGGAAFLAGKVWPYLTIRDTEERARRYDIDMLQAQAQLDAIKAQMVFATAIDTFSGVVAQCVTMIAEK